MFSNASSCIVDKFTGDCLGASGLNFKNYHPVTTFHKYLECLGSRYGDMVSVFDIGRSTERRPLKVIKIGRPSSDGRIKPAVWIDGGIHAREWISPASVEYLVHQLVEKCDLPENKNLVESFDLYILPIMNPDGYAIFFIPKGS